MSALSQRAKRINSSTNTNDFKEGGKGGVFSIEKPEKKYNNSKNLPNGMQLIQIINKKCKNIKP